MRLHQLFAVRRTFAVPSAFAVLIAAVPLSAPAHLYAQAASTSPAAASTRIIGTVQSVSSTQLTLSKDDGTKVVLTLADAVRVQQLPPGSTDIKAAQDATTADIAVGDRVLVVARAADAGSMTASRVVLMKSSAIAQTNASREADWQKRGAGGLVTAVDPATQTISVVSGTRKLTVQASGKTIFRRYASGSVKFELAKVGTIADIHVGDQLRVRGSRDVDTGSIAADEIVTGSFSNVAGLIGSVDAAAGTLTVKDLATKKNVVVAIGPDSDLRELPPEMAAHFAARAHSSATASTAGAHAPSAAPVSQPDTAPTRSPGSGAGTGRSGAGGSADLSQAVPHLPKITLSALKPGEAVMVVGSGAQAGASITAITLLSGVEPLLAASPSGTSGFNLSPWSMGGGEAAAGGTQ